MSPPNRSPTQRDNHATPWYHNGGIIPEFSQLSAGHVRYNAIGGKAKNAFLVGHLCLQPWHGFLQSYRLLACFLCDTRRFCHGIGAIRLPKVLKIGVPSGPRHKALKENARFVKENEGKCRPAQSWPELRRAGVGWLGLARAGSGWFGPARPRACRGR